MEVTLDVKWVIAIESLVNFVFQWSHFDWGQVTSFPEGTHIKVELLVDWEVKAKFEATVKVKAQKLMKEIFEAGFTFVFPLGPVPVVVRPYAKLSAGIDIPEFKVCRSKLYTFSLNFHESWHVFQQK